MGKAPHGSIGLIEMMQHQSRSPLQEILAGEYLEQLILQTIGWKL